MEVDNPVDKWEKMLQGNKMVKDYTEREKWYKKQLAKGMKCEKELAALYVKRAHSYLKLESNTTQAKIALENALAIMPEGKPKEKLQLNTLKWEYVDAWGRTGETPEFSWALWGHPYRVLSSVDRPQIEPSRTSY